MEVLDAERDECNQDSTRQCETNIAAEKTKTSRDKQPRGIKQQATN
ncbi:hypothetical protein [Paraburkholderia azotifigens]|nr:hypothetical protein [Paraburkholderia azotifigens]